MTDEPTFAPRFAPAPPALCAALVRGEDDEPARCRHLHARGSDLCYGHKSIEDAGAEVRRVSEVGTWPTTS